MSRNHKLKVTSQYYYKRICKFDFYVEFRNNLIKRIYLYFPDNSDGIIIKQSYPCIVKLCFGYLENRLLNMCVCVDFEIFDMSNYTKFKFDVLNVLKNKIEYGKTISYKKLGELAGYNNSQRAVGSVMKNNQFPIIFPCHRVIKSDKEIGGFQKDERLKKRLLDFEKLLLENSMKK